MHADELLRMASVITWDDDAAEDLVQECLLRLARRWPRVRKMDLPLAYARKVLINVALDDRRRRSRRQAELGVDESQTDLADLRAEAQLETLSRRSELIDAFGRLSPQQRTVLMLRYFHDLSEAQIADLLGCSTGTVKSSTSRGLARLRALIGGPVSPPEVCEP